jgi:hypothetical protein
MRDTSPVFAQRRAEIHRKRNLEDSEAMQRVRQNQQPIGSKDDAFSGAEKQLQHARLQHSYLLVFVTAYRHDCFLFSDVQAMGLSASGVRVGVVLARAATARNSYAEKVPGYFESIAITLQKRNRLVYGSPWRLLEESCVRRETNKGPIMQDWALCFRVVKQ